MRKVVLVTGGGRGIGAATCVLAAQKGWDVAVNYAANAEAAQQVVKQIQATGARAIAVQADVADEAQVLAMFKRVKAELGPLQGLVNNAGVMPLGPLDAETEQIRDLTLDVNVRGVLNGMQAVLGTMARRGGGQVINVASMAGILPLPFAPTYAATKAGIINYTR
jgi:NAD(P)-dependent dehydrogenase (short-subunit alcohol dehydrogenase family)